MKNITYITKTEQTLIQSFKLIILLKLVYLICNVVHFYDHFRCYVVMAAKLKLYITTQTKLLSIFSPNKIMHIPYMKQCFLMFIDSSLSLLVPHCN